MKRIICFCMLTTIILCSCSENIQSNLGQVTLKNTDNYEGSYKNIDRGSDESKHIAERVSAIVCSVEDVEDATVVISGDSAIVGIKVIGDLTDDKLLGLKNDIEKKVLNQVPEVKKVTVTAYPELAHKISDSANEIIGEGEKPNLDDKSKEILQKLTPPV